MLEINCVLSKSRSEIEMNWKELIWNFTLPNKDLVFENYYKKSHIHIGMKRIIKLDVNWNQPWTKSFLDQMIWNSLQV